MLDTESLGDDIRLYESSSYKIGEEEWRRDQLRRRLLAAGATAEDIAAADRRVAERLQDTERRVQKSQAWQGSLGGAP